MCTRSLIKIILSLFIFREGGKEGGREGGGERERERERERKRTHAGVGQREREGDRIPSRLCTVRTEPDAGLELTNREVMT